MLAGNGASLHGRFILVVLGLSSNCLAQVVRNVGRRDLEVIRHVVEVGKGGTNHFPVADGLDGQLAHFVAVEKIGLTCGIDCQGFRRAGQIYYVWCRFHCWSLNEFCQSFCFFFSNSGAVASLQRCIRTYKRVNNCFCLWLV